jgi:hypothetical protein
MPLHKVDDPVVRDLAQGASQLRQKTVHLYTHLLTQKEMIAQLREEVARLQALTPAAPHPSGLSVEFPPAADMDVFESVVLDSLAREEGSRLEGEHLAPPAKPATARATRDMRRWAAPVTCLVLAWIAATRLHFDSAVLPPKAEPAAAPVVVKRAPPVDLKLQEAVALARQWRMAGDDLTLFERLGRIDKDPGGVAAWKAKKLEDGSYVVTFRASAGSRPYVFAADLPAKTIRPEPESTDRLTLLRVVNTLTALRHGPDAQKLGALSAESVQ